MALCLARKWFVPRAFPAATVRERSSNCRPINDRELMIVSTSRRFFPLSRRSGRPDGQDSRQQFAYITQRTVCLQAGAMNRARGTACRAPAPCQRLLRRDCRPLVRSAGSAVLPAPKPFHTIEYGTALSGWLTVLRRRNSLARSLHLVERANL